MKKIIYIVLIIMSFSAKSQVNKYGIPLIKNYSNQDYGAGEQNWSAVQDNRGIMYFGNNDDGVLEYDGVFWRKIAISNKSIVRSLAVDKNGRVYVGAVGEFGFLAPDITGNLKYISLSEKLDTANSHFKDVHKVYCVDKNVYFCSPGYVFLYNGTQIKTIKSSKYNFLSFVLDGKIYSGDYFQGLMEYNGDSMTVSSGGDFFSYMNLVSLSKKEQQYVVSTASDGMFYYNPKTGIVDSNITERKLNDDFMNNVLYNSQNITQKQQAHSTLYGSGLLITDSIGNLIYQIKKSNGLRDEQITYSYQNLNSKNQPLWVTSSNGISKISNNIPFTFFDDKSGLEGLVLDVKKYNGILYVATTSGVFYKTNDENNLPIFKAIDEIGLTWKLYEFIINEKESKLFAGSGDGLFEIVNKNQAIEVEKSIVNIEANNRYKIDYIYQSKSDKNLLILGANKNIIALRYNKNNTWTIEFKLPVKDAIKTIVEDNNKNIWFGTSYSGIMRFSLKDKFKRLKVYSKESGLKDINSYVFELNNKVLFSDDKGIYNFDGNRFIPELIFGKTYADGSTGVAPNFTDSENYTWFSLSQSNPKKNWLVAIMLKNNKPVVDSIPFKILPNVVIDVVYEDDEQNIWIGNSKGLYCYNRNFDRNYKESYKTLIRKVIVGTDSIAFNGTYFEQKSEKDSIFSINNIQPEILKTVLKYSDNNITFQFAAPFFDAEELTLYSSQLEGYRNDEWSKWDSKTERVFTNLKEGSYTFRVKARNIFGVESEVAVYEFSVLPPWYRTYLAYFGYIILLVVNVYFIIKFYTRKLELDKIRLEGIVVERTAEVVKQKEEVERQKDVVMQQKEHIEHIHHELKDSIFYAERIQKAILPHKDYAEENMDDHFILFKPKDIVSGDFYFANKHNENLIFAAADCTGHGVPGAFMSMLGVAFLNEIVNEGSAKTSGQILDALRQNIIKSLQQTGREGENKDGMDLSICSIDLKNNKLQWTGANNPLYLVRKSDSETETLTYLCNQEEITIEPSLFENGYNLYEFKPDKMPVAIYIKMDNFTTNTIDLKHEDALYVFTDGFADQFGGPKGKKYMYKPFKNLILSMQGRPLEEHKHALDESIELWKAHVDPITNDFFEQVDDICVIGYKFILKE